MNITKNHAILCEIIAKIGFTPIHVNPPQSTWAPEIVQHRPKSLLQCYHFSSLQNLLVQRHLSDFNWLAWIMSRLEKATKPPLLSGLMGFP